MDLIYQPIQCQQQVLSQNITESLTVLQMPLIDLYDYISEKAMENPVLDVKDPELLCSELPQISDADASVWESGNSSFYAPRKTPELSSGPLTDLITRPSGDFSEMLHHQLALEHRIPSDLLPLCDFLVECLDRRGYLTDSLDFLAEFTETSVDRITQALYALQEMTPAGVGARNLQECLILQLVKTEEFNPLTLKLIREGLELLAGNHIRSIARLLKVSEAEALECCAAIRRLEPIPSRGYNTGDKHSYVIPEAEVLWENGRLVVRYNDHAIPQIHINDEYRKILNQSTDSETTAYLRRHLASADFLVHEITWRKNTVLRVLEYLIAHQQAFFLKGFSALTPLVLADVAEALELSPSTVGRAVRGKYIVTPQGTIEIKQLFSVRASTGGESSAAAVKERIRTLVMAEDRSYPLSDEKLCAALQALGISTTRRTVAKYRNSIGIPPASRRRVQQ